MKFLWFCLMTVGFTVLARGEIEILQGAARVSFEAYHHLPDIRWFSRPKEIARVTADDQAIDPVKVVADGSAATIIKFDPYLGDDSPDHYRLSFKPGGQILPSDNLIITVGRTSLGEGVIAVINPGDGPRCSTSVELTVSNPTNELAVLELVGDGGLSTIAPGFGSPRPHFGPGCPPAAPTDTQSITVPPGTTIVRFRMWFPNRGIDAGSPEPSPYSNPTRDYPLTIRATAAPNSNISPAEAIVSLRYQDPRSVGKEITLATVNSVTIDPADPRETGSFGSLSFSGGRFTARYTHPTMLADPETPSTWFIMEIRHEPTDTIILSVRFEVYRTPVVMIHGLWSDSSAFTAMEKTLTSPVGSQPRPRWLPFLAHSADYRQTNAAPFADNKDVVVDAINHVLATAREANVSAGKVDVIGHSMGGILARRYLRDQKYQGNIRRLITLNTPHAGTQMANVVNLSPALQKTLAALKKDPWGGAIEDLAVDSQAILGNLNGALPDFHLVPSHVITTTTPLGWLGELKENAISVTLNRLYNGEEHDLVVPLSSQMGGIGGMAITNNPFSTLIPDQGHAGSAANPFVIANVVNLLRINSGNLLTDKGFFPPILSFSLDRPITHSLRAATAAHKAGSLEITSPADGDIVQGGEIIPVSVSAGGAITGLQFLAGNQETDTFSAVQNTGGSHTFSYPVPADVVGSIGIVVVGFDDDGYVDLRSITISVNAPSELLRILPRPHKVFVPSGTTFQLVVRGEYADEITRDLTQAAGVSYFSADESVAKISSRGMISGIAAGKTTITASCQGKQMAVEVEALPQGAWEIITSSSDVWWRYR